MTASSKLYVRPEQENKRRYEEFSAGNSKQGCHTANDKTGSNACNELHRAAKKRLAGAFRIVCEEQHRGDEDE